MSSVLDRLVKYSLPIGISLTAALSSIYTGTVEMQSPVVDGGQRAVIFDRIRGVSREVVGEGAHFLIPFLQRAIIFDVRTKPRSITSTTGSRDHTHLPDIYTKLGVDYDERVLPSIANEVLKAIVAQFNAGELITQREIVSARIREELIPRAADFNILLEDVSLTHLNFGKDFTRAVEEKQIAQQEAERAKFIVEMAEHEKNAAVIKAQGEAQAARLISDAISSAGSGMIQLRKLEAAREIAQTLTASKNVSYLPSSNVDLLLNMGGSQ